VLSTYLLVIIEISQLMIMAEKARPGKPRSERFQGPYNFFLCVLG
jgi:hypothetical protein